MERVLSRLLSLTIAGFGIVMIAGGIMGFTLGSAENQSVVLYGIAISFAIWLALAIVVPLFAGIDYRKAQRWLLLTLSFLCFCFLCYFLVMPMLVGDMVIKVSICATFPLLGIAALLLAGLNSLICSEDYRPMIMDFIMQSPYLYYRYKT